ncbi:MAG: L,D-transpeptidase family protein [Sulfurovum sp.]|nr:L,D-transpeptidase family protein [Sulfurovum sp.]
MIRSVLKLTLLSVLLFSAAEASVEEYKKLHEEINRDFDKKLSTLIREHLQSSSKEVQKLYRAIGYKPVWVDREYLSAFGSMLLGELKDDIDHGTMLSLKPAYEKIQREVNDLNASTSLQKKLQIEMDIMQLYADHIGTLLAGSDSMLTPAILLTESLKQGSLVHSFNAVSQARILKRTPSLKGKETSLLGSEIVIDANATKHLTEGSDEKRLKEMYKLLDYQPVWISEKGYSSFTKVLFNTIGSDPVFDHNGPTWKRYVHLKALPVPTQKKDIVKQEFEIARLYQDYMGYLLYGAIDWKQFKAAMRKKSRHSVWDVHEVLLSPELLLVESVKAGTLEHAFAKAKPEYPGYERLVKGLQKYRAIAEAGGWSKLPDFKDLKPGMHDPVVPLLRERLRIEGDYKACEGSDANSTKYDDCLLKAVKKFQARHGLQPEGYIGKLTRKALDETAQHKYVRLRLSIARLKWLKRDLEKYHVVANIPDFRITVYKGWEPIESMRVVTGRKGHETPVFYNRVKRIVLNPYWNIPPSIVRHETLPKLMRNPGYAAQKHIEILKGSAPINPHRVNWHQYQHKYPPYRFRQTPGTFNALGKVKFLFPNRYSVYMHDTPEKALFARDIRAFSHGCVRLHRPMDMLETFSKIDPKIKMEKAKHILEQNRNTPINLSKSIPIDIIYLSAWVNPDGEVQFREDIYGYDALQIKTAKWLPGVEG